MLNNVAHITSRLEVLTIYIITVEILLINKTLVNPNKSIIYMGNSPLIYDSHL